MLITILKSKKNTKQKKGTNLPFCSFRSVHSASSVHSGSVFLKERKERSLRVKKIKKKQKK